ncbi:Rop family plasmid primer RNA-binding protein, partial [Salmonella enterica]|uniref:Rop family plasmid primer RNA-binding protein n=1 Tax=Salmonella enterica TaxID=28901 RepID=UPI00398C4E3F
KKRKRSRIQKQPYADLNMVKCIRAQYMLTDAETGVLDLVDGAADWERMHEQAEALYQKRSARFGIQDGE